MTAMIQRRAILKLEATRSSEDNDEVVDVIPRASRARRSLVVDPER